MSPPTRIAKLTRVRLLEKDGGRTIHFRLDGGRRPQFIPTDAVPEFEGDEAWFELEHVRAKPWNTWRVIRRVEPT